MKSFKIWVEEKESQSKLKHMLLSRLGFTNNAMDTQTIKIKDIQKERLIHALSSMHLPEEDFEQLKNWLQMYPDSTLQELLAQIPDATEEEPDLPSVPAKLPKGLPMEG